jgi:phosphatidate phosphatase APP1
MSTTSNVMTPEPESMFEPDLQSVLYSSYAYLHPRRPVWRIQVQGRLYSDRAASLTQRLLLRGLERKLKLTPEQAQGELFRSRVAGFMTSPEGGLRIQLQNNGQLFKLRSTSKSSGLFQGRLDIPRDRFDGSQTSISLSTWGDFRSTEGKVFLAGASGISVVSDIDDTIKLTEVTSRSRMLSRTFLEDFAPIHGMAKVYQHWAQQGGLFHYVSSSPWQIYGPLQEYLLTHGFPEGTMHLKWFRLRDEFLKRWRIIRRKGKAGVIAAMIKRMPYRRFLLIGDSGERDPEIYAKIARRFPYQVVGCLIRNLEERPVDQSRFDTLKKKFGLVPFHLFREPSEIIDTLEKAQGAN